MPITNHTLTVSIGGVDKTSSLLKDSLLVRLQLNSKANIAELKFKDYQPDERAEVLISVNGTVIFGGVVVRKVASLKGVRNLHYVEWTVECKDWTEILEQVIVDEKYTYMSDSEVVQDLFTTYLSGFGFDTNAAMNTLDGDLDITFTNVSVREALDKLAERVGATWFIKPDKVVYWFDPQNPALSALSISSTPDNVTTFPFLQNSLSYEIDSSSIVNQVKIVAGTKSTGTKVVDTLSADGTRKSFTLSQIPDTVRYCTYTTPVGSYTTYGDFVGFAPADKLVSEGGSYQAVIDPANKILKVEGGSQEAPSNATNVVIEYYYKETIDLTISDTASQALFGTYPYTLLNQTFNSPEEATAIAQKYLETNAYGKSLIRFDSTTYGFIPGELLDVHIPEIGIAQGSGNTYILLENGDRLLLENDDYLLLETVTAGYQFLIQEVSFSPVITHTDEFMIVCSVSAGRYIPNILDALGKVQELRSNQGTSAEKAIPNRLSNISSNLGEVNAGRALFTDGGTAQFTWSNPGGATGIVLGLENENATYGVAYVYEGGTVRAKLGRMDDVPMIGTVQPSGWGLYTQNGFFSGIVAASQLIGNTITGNQIVGGTITGGLITGGTVTGALVSGGTVTGNTFIGGTIATSAPPINSSNPGVIMDSTGLYGYGTVGLVFRLSSDPAIKPWFSSGTILNTVYEINTSAVLRTGTTNPRIQIDNSGIFAYDSGGNLRFTVDVSTGRLTASQGTFSGTVSASAITASTLTGNTVTAGTITSNQITSGTITGNTLSSNTITTNTITANTLTANNITSGTITGNTLSSNTITTNTLTSNSITSGTITGNTLSSNTITANTLTANNITSGTITGNTITGNTITGNTITGGTINTAGGTVTVTDNGIRLLTPTTYASGNASNIQWLTSGTITGELSNSYDSGTAYMKIFTGQFGGGVPGVLTLSTRSASGVLTFAELRPTTITLSVEGTDYLLISSTGETSTNTNFISDASSSNRQLGKSGASFRYLYLKDDNGVDRRVSINSAGVLTVT